MSTVEAPASHLPLPMQNILSRLAANSTEAEQALVRKAYAYAAAAHAGQVRLSGEPYLSHPLAVAEVLAELGFDAHSVAAGLLHDTVEDTKVTLEEVDAEFGEQVADIVDGVTKIEKDGTGVLLSYIPLVANDWYVLTIIPADLLGKTIACQMPETGQMVLKNYIMEQGYTFGAPGEGADITFVYVNDAIPAIEGCVKGEYDYCITNSCLGYYAGQYGAALVGTVKQFVDPYPCCRQTCNEATYEDNFEALVRFEIANLRGYEYYLNNMEETLDILEDYSGEDRDFL